MKFYVKNNKDFSHQDMKSYVIFTLSIYIFNDLSVRESVPQFWMTP
jgi:hypothetical protein